MDFAITTPNVSAILDRRIQPRLSTCKPGIDKLRRNNLLSLLPEDELWRLEPHVELIHLPHRKILCDLGDTSGYVYFPTTSIMSILYSLADGTCDEISMVGKDGVIGFAAFMGGERSASQVLVLRSGECYRINRKFILNEFYRAGFLMKVLLRNTEALMTQIAQNVVCNRHHHLYQQMCRLLLLILDRQESNQIMLTQEIIAKILGVRREGVTETALKLQHDGLISYCRGHIKVLDRYGLEQNTCECYHVVKKEYERLCTPPFIL
ncbi:MAG: Crp/Fnr family transcriptional regulator [Undibacterium sp.]|nr:Crp/Fnr family transcriptional regulator [Undibacterium sp.]